MRYLVCIERNSNRISSELLPELDVDLFKRLEVKVRVDFVIHTVSEFGLYIIRKDEYKIRILDISFNGDFRRATDEVSYKHNMESYKDIIRELKLKLIL